MASQIVEAKQAFEKVVAHFKEDIGGLRTGRATAAIVEGVLVEAYGSMMEIRALGTIGCPDARTIVVDPWDKSLMKNIEKAISDARVGTNPIVDGQIIRLSFPPMTEDSRKQVVKSLKQKLEEARIALRQTREDLKEGILAREKAGGIGEDERFRQTAELDELTKEYNGKLEEMAEHKEEEIMTI